MYFFWFSSFFHYKLWTKALTLCLFLTLSVSLCLCLFLCMSLCICLSVSVSPYTPFSPCLILLSLAFMESLITWKLWKQPPWLQNILARSLSLLNPAWCTLWSSWADLLSLAVGSMIMDHDFVLAPYEWKAWNSGTSLSREDQRLLCRISLKSGAY